MSHTKFLITQSFISTTNLHVWCCLAANGHGDHKAKEWDRPARSQFKEANWRRPVICVHSGCAQPAAAAAWIISQQSSCEEGTSTCLIWQKISADQHQILMEYTSPPRFFFFAHKFTIRVYMTECVNCMRCLCAGWAHEPAAGGYASHGTLLPYCSRSCGFCWWVVSWINIWIFCMKCSIRPCMSRTISCAAW